jgi:hypothetical protein
MYAKKTREEWKSTLLEGKDWNEDNESGGENDEAEVDEGEDGEGEDDDMDD